MDIEKMAGPAIIGSLWRVLSNIGLSNFGKLWSEVLFLYGLKSKFNGPGLADIIRKGQGEELIDAIVSLAPAIKATLKTPDGKEDLASTVESFFK